MNVLKKIFLWLLLAVAVGAFWWYTSQPHVPLVLMPNTVVSSTAQMNTAQLETPPPLHTQQTVATILTAIGVFNDTNTARRQNGNLSPLKLNAQLTAAAQAKVKDMFTKQYFDHLSPSGKGPGDLAKSEGYQFLLVGENLAYGDFGSDQALVDAWMASPGHRANILRPNYQDIGVAVGEGTYQGHTTWMAVQEFGRPLSACPEPDITLKTKIDTDKQQLASLQAQANTMKQQLDSQRPNSRRDVAAYNAEVDAYNNVVHQIDNLVTTIQGEVTVYNGDVQVFNTCAQA